MTFQDYFPIWNKLQTDQQDRIRSNLNFRTVKKGTILHNGDMDCTGLLLVKAGQLRAYILSDEGREITIYRLFDRDLCLFSASCIMRSIQFEVTIQAEKDTDLWVIPAEVYQDIMETSAPVANYTNELMASRFSEVMWLMEQVMWKSLDKRLAAFLLEEDQEMAVYSTEGRCMIFHTSALSPKTTRTTQGVNVMSLKPKYRVEKALPLAQTPIRNAARYRARSLPIAGMLLRPEDRAEEQMTLLE